MAWIAVNPKAPTELQNLSQSISSGLTALRTALELVRVQVRGTITNVLEAESAAVTAINSALNALIDSANVLIDQLLDTTGLYVLLIPLPKKGLAHLLYDPANTNDNGTNIVNFPVNNVLASATEQQRKIISNSSLWQQIVDPSDLLLGGSGHLVNTIADALFDPGDPNRPQFTPTTSWAYFFMTAGSSDLTSLLQIANFMDRLFGGSNNANHVGTSRGVTNLVPRNLTVTPSGRGTVPIIQWAFVSPVTALLSFNETRVIATKWAVIRSEQFQARAAKHVLDLFNTTNLVPGLIGRYGAIVLAVEDYNGVTTRFVDETPLKPGFTYFYHVAFATALENAPVVKIHNSPDEQSRDEVPVTTEKVDVGFGPLSSAGVFQVPSTRQDFNGNRTSRIPDWIRTPSVVSIIPPLNEFLDRVKEFFNSIRSTSRNLTQTNQDFIAFLDREIDTYAAKIADIERITQQLVNIFNAPTAGLYGTYRTGTGNTASFLSDIIQALEDYEDPNRPAFDNGDEYVIGAVFLAVGPDPGPIQDAVGLFKNLFDPIDVNDPALTGINSIQTTLAAVEENLLQQLGAAPSSAPSLTFNEDLTPRAAGQGDFTCDPTS